MTDVVVLALIAAEMALIAALLAWDTLRKPKADIVGERARREVILTTKTGEGFRGVLYAQDHRALLLRNATAVGAGERGADISVDGELLVLREDVAYLQVL